MYVKVDQYNAQNTGSIVVNLRCPRCGQRGTFDTIGGADVTITTRPNTSCRAGYRRCPDPSCLALLFFVSQGNDLAVTYPAERIDFDGTDVPRAVLAALEEAITCHANRCFIAAAIMVRKTLEELCRDREAGGANLKARIQALGSKILLPTELLAGLDDLRLLGNDAAHIESHEYDKVGPKEVEVGIEFAKEVLKAVYQYSALLNKLRALKKPPETHTASDK